METGQTPTVVHTKSNDDILFYRTSTKATSALADHKHTKSKRTMTMAIYNSIDEMSRVQISTLLGSGQLI